MRTHKIVSATLIAVFLSSTAYAGGLSVNYDIRKPLNPPSVSGTVGKNTYTVTPTPLGPAVTSTGTGEGDKLLNKAAGPGLATNKAIDDGARNTGKALDDGAKAVNKAVDDAGRGIGHFFNEIGMAWANFKNDLIKKAQDAAKPYIDKGFHFLILAGIGLAAILVFLPMMTAYLTARFMRRA
jgi:hypothetical protein